MTTNSSGLEPSDPFVATKINTTMSTSKPSSISERPMSGGEGARPAISKQWQTERPQPTTKESLLQMPALKHHDTNAAKPKAIWSNTREDDSSSSSSSDDEEDRPRQKKRSLPGRPKNTRGVTGSYRKFNVGNDDFNTKGRVSKKDGRLNISVNETNNTGYLAKALGATFLKGVTPETPEGVAGDHFEHTDEAHRSERSSDATITSDLPIPVLNIVVMVIGSRGDIQPFLKLGKNLKEYGHRVRIATHPAFKDFVQKDSGLEFFSVGGDPAELMAFMVKNPGMIPTMDTLKKGEVGRRRNQMAEMFEGFWRACINATDDEKDVSNLKMMGQKAPFIADAIIGILSSFPTVCVHVLSGQFLMTTSQSSFFCTYPLCRKVRDTFTSHVHISVYPYTSISSSIDKYQEIKC